MTSHLFFLVLGLLVRNSAVSADLVKNKKAFLYERTQCEYREVSLTLDCPNSGADYCLLGQKAYVSGTICGTLPEMGTYKIYTCISGYCNENTKSKSFHAEDFPGTYYTNINACGGPGYSVSGLEVTVPRATGRLWPGTQCS